MQFNNMISRNNLNFYYSRNWGLHVDTIKWDTGLKNLLQHFIGPPKLN